MSPLSLDGQSLAALVEEAMTPYIGRNMARASTKMHVEKLGLEGSVSAEDLERLLERLGKALRVFVGGPKTEEVIAEIRAGVGPETGRG